MDSINRAQIFVSWMPEPLKTPTPYQELKKSWTVFLGLSTLVCWIWRVVITKLSLKRVTRRELHSQLVRLVSMNITAFLLAWPTVLQCTNDSWKIFWETTTCGYICLIYLDDIIISSRTYEEHVDRLRKVFQRIHDAGLKLALKKCKLFKEKVVYVGHTIFCNGIEPDPAKTETIRNWPTPKTPEDVHNFSGLQGITGSLSRTSRRLPPHWQFWCPLPRRRSKGRGNNLARSHGSVEKSRRLHSVI